MSDDSPASSRAAGEGDSGKHEPLPKLGWEPAEPVLLNLGDQYPSSDSLISLKRDQHDSKLREWSLIGLGGAYLAGLCLIGAGMALRWFDGDFAKSLIQATIGPLLGATTTIIGYLFAERKR